MAVKPPSRGTAWPSMKLASKLRSQQTWAATAVAVAMRPIGWSAASCAFVGPPPSRSRSNISVRAAPGQIGTGAAAAIQFRGLTHLCMCGSGTSGCQLEDATTPRVQLLLLPRRHGVALAGEDSSVRVSSLLGDLEQNKCVFLEVVRSESAASSLNRTTHCSVSIDE